MAEVIGILGSCIAICQLVGYGKKFSRMLYKFSKCAGVPTEQLERLANQSDIFWNSIGTAQLSIRRHGEKCYRSPTLDYTLKNRVLEGIEIEATFIKRDLSAAIDRLGDVANSSLTVVRLLKWLRHRESILMPFPQMELVQTCLQLLVSAIQLEAYTSMTDGQVHEARRENTRLQKDMDFLRKVIKNQVRTIARLECRLGRADQRVQRGSIAASSKFVHKSGIDALIRLGHSVAETGFLPRQRSPASSSESSLETLTSISEVEARPPVTRTIRDGRETAMSQDRTQSHSPSLKVFPSTTTQATTGYVTSADGTVISATATVMRGLEASIMSIGAASRLGLVVERQNDDDAVWVTFESGKAIQTIGKVSLSWNGTRTQANVRPHTDLQCLVVEHCRPEIILGKSFYDRMVGEWREIGN